MKPPSVKVQKLAARLQGTSDHATDEIEELTQEETEQLDHLMFCCTVCNWWFTQAERDKNKDDWMCVECGAQA